MDRRPTRQQQQQLFAPPRSSSTPPRLPLLRRSTTAHGVHVNAHSTLLARTIIAVIITNSSIPISFSGNRTGYDSVPTRVGRRFTTVEL